MKTTNDRSALTEHDASAPSNEVIHAQLRALRERVERIEKTNERTRENPFRNDAEYVCVPLWLFRVFSTLFLLLLIAPWIAAFKAR